MYKKGSHMGHADALSRLPLTEKVKQSYLGADVLQFTRTRKLPVTAKDVATATKKSYTVKGL